MSIHEPLVPEVLDPGADAFRLRMAVGGFLAGYGTSTGEAYALDLRQWAAWCEAHDLGLFEVRRAHIERPRCRATRRTPAAGVPGSPLVSRGPVGVQGRM